MLNRYARHAHMAAYGIPGVDHPFGVVGMCLVPMRLRNTQ
jgi:hypothetical protein